MFQRKFFGLGIRPLECPIRKKMNMSRTEHLPNMREPGKRPLRILITAGPTAEDIDPVRFIANRSSGRVGIALAGAARNAGMNPLLILGPTASEPPSGVETVRVRSAADMLAAVLDRLAWADCLVMAAAVADYAPAEPLEKKLKKGEGDLLLRLRRTKDILREIMRLPERDRLYVVGFSLDAGMNLDEGRRKLAAKRMDAVVVNDASTFGSERIDATVIEARGGETALGSLSKEEFAVRLLGMIEKGLGVCKSSFLPTRR